MFRSVKYFYQFSQNITRNKSSGSDKRNGKVCRWGG